jgi:hypothetical protein
MTREANILKVCEPGKWLTSWKAAALTSDTHGGLRDGVSFGGSELSMGILSHTDDVRVGAQSSDVEEQNRIWPNAQSINEL